MNVFRGITFAGLLTVAGCAGLPRDLASEPRELLPDEGMLVIEVTGYNTDWDGASVFIDRRDRGMLFGGMALLKLKAGEHTFDGIRKVTGSETRSIPLDLAGLPTGYVTTTRYKSVSSQRRFTIEAGKVTSLGQLVRVAEGGTSTGRVLSEWLDNSAHIRELIQSVPSLSGLRAETVSLAPGVYATPSELTELRKAIADVVYADKSKSGFTGNYVVGPAGTVAELVRGRDGHVKSLQLMNINTVAPFTASHSDRRGRLGMVTTQRAYLLLDGKLEQKLLPTRAVVKQVHLFGARSVLLATANGEVHISDDSGHTWRKTLLPETAEGVRAYYDVEVTGMDWHIYLFSREQNRLFRLAENQNDLKRIELPPGARLQLVKTMKTGLFLKASGLYYHQTADSPVWKTIDVLNRSKCASLRFMEDQGLRLQASCASAVLESEDGGQTWKRL